MRGERGWAGASTLLAVVLLASACGGSDPAPRAPAPRMAAEVVQLRRDEVLKRLQVAVTNRSAEPVTIESIELRVPGFSGAWTRWPSRSRCPRGSCRPADAVRPDPLHDRRAARGWAGPPSSCGCTPRDRPDAAAGGAAVAQQPAAAPADRHPGVRGAPARPGGVARRSGRPGGLAGAGADATVHGTLVARLRTDQPKDLTQLAGTVIYDLAADPPVRPEGAPLLRLTPDHPDGSLGIVVSRSRCDGHARGETKQPYAFLVWVGPPGTAGIAVTPTVTAADRAAFQRVCPL